MDGAVSHKSYESAQNRCGAGPGVGLKDPGAARRVPRAQGDSIEPPLSGRTLLWRARPRSDGSHFRAEGALTSGCIPSHYSPRFLKRPLRTTEPTLFGAMDRVVTDIESRPESLRMGYMGSLEGPGGRAPRRRSPRRLYRGLCAATHTSSVSPDRAQEGAFSRRRRTYIRVYPLH